MDPGTHELWNQRYSEGGHSSLEPSAFMVQAFDRFIHPAFPHGGYALDLAGGVGRHSIYLAEQGRQRGADWHVTLTDISDVALEQARKAADDRGIQLETIAADSLHFGFGVGSFDLITVFLYLERALFRPITEALRPGGLLVYRTFTCEHERFGRKPESDRAYYLKVNELLHAFPALRVVHYEELDGLAELVARK